MKAQKSTMADRVHTDASPAPTQWKSWNCGRICDVRRCVRERQGGHQQVELVELGVGYVM